MNTNTAINCTLFNFFMQGRRCTPQTQYYISSFYQYEPNIIYVTNTNISLIFSFYKYKPHIVCLVFINKNHKFYVQFLIIQPRIVYLVSTNTNLTIQIKFLLIKTSYYLFNFQKYKPHIIHFLLKRRIQVDMFWPYTQL